MSAIRSIFICQKLLVSFALKSKELKKLQSLVFVISNQRTQNKLLSRSYSSYLQDSKLLDSLTTIALENNPENLEKEEIRDDLERNLGILQSHSVTESDIKTYLRHFYGRSSYKKVTLLTQMNENLTPMLPLLELSQITLNRVAKQTVEDLKFQSGFTNRVAYLEHHLNLPLEELVSLLRKHFSLLTMCFSRLETKMNILKSANIDSEDLAKDPWIFNYHEKLLSDRVTEAKTLNMTLKPWMLRCSQKYFNKSLFKWKETHAVLGNDDVLGYLAKRLDCSKDYMTNVMKENAVHRINAIKLQKLLEFLFDKGYSPEEIRLFPKVFCSSVSTLNKRYDVFLSKRNRIPTIPELSISSAFNKSMRFYDKKAPTSAGKTEPNEQCINAS